MKVWEILRVKDLLWYYVLYCMIFVVYCVVFQDYFKVDWSGCVERFEMYPVSIIYFSPLGKFSIHVYYICVCVCMWVLGAYWSATIRCMAHLLLVYFYSPSLFQPCVNFHLGWWYVSIGFHLLFRRIPISYHYGNDVMSLGPLRLGNFETLYQKRQRQGKEKKTVWRIEKKGTSFGVWSLY